MNQEDLKKYMQLVEDVILLYNQKDDLYRKVIQSYDTHKADVYMKKIQHTSKLVEKNVQEMEKLKMSLRVS